MRSNDENSFYEYMKYQTICLTILNKITRKNMASIVHVSKAEVLNPEWLVKECNQEWYKGLDRERLVLLGLLYRRVSSSIKISD